MGLEGECAYIIYIPLWFYSNRNPGKASRGIEPIYIPLWFYSNAEDPEKVKDPIQFTFHYGSILIRRGSEA